MIRALALHAPDTTWVPKRMIHWCSVPYVKRGQVCYVPREGGWHHRDLGDRDRWPRVRGDQISDPGYDPARWYPIPLACFLAYPLGSTIWCRPEPTRALSL